MILDILKFFKDNQLIATTILILVTTKIIDIITICYTKHLELKNEKEKIKLNIN